MLLGVKHCAYITVHPFTHAFFFCLNNRPGCWLRSQEEACLFISMHNRVPGEFLHVHCSIYRVQCVRYSLEMSSPLLLLIASRITCLADT